MCVCYTAIMTDHKSIQLQTTDLITIGLQTLQERKTQGSDLVVRMTSEAHMMLLWGISEVFRFHLANS